MSNDFKCALSMVVSIMINEPQNTEKLKVLMISSSGGHWIQMNRLLPIFSGEDVVFSSTVRSYSQTNPERSFHYIPEASRSSGVVSLLYQALCILKLLICVRPNIIISTGASSGFFAVFFGKKLGMKTIWIDSIANVDCMSLSGEKAVKYADLYLTQWKELAQEGGPEYFGAVI